MTSKTKSKSKSPTPKTKPAARRRAKARGTGSPSGRAKSRGAAAGPTLADLSAGFLAHLEACGKTAATVASYRADLGVALRHFGPDVAAASITPDEVAEFNESAAVTRTRKGKPKAKPGVDKTRRVLRLALCWAADQGTIGCPPMPPAPISQ